MIKKVIEHNDTITKLTNRIIKHYPKYLIRKTKDYNNGEMALKQIRREIGSILSRNSNIFKANKTVKPYQYSIKHAMNIGPATKAALNEIEKQTAFIKKILAGL